MLSVILIWLYMIVTTFLLGYGIMAGTARFSPYKVRHLDSYLMCGLAGTTVYAELFSIFAPVGLEANLVLIVICLLVAFLCRKRLLMDFRNQVQAMRERQTVSGGKFPGQIYIFLILFFFFAYGTSRGIIHYDTSLYHAQSIRWIEEYGVVKGLGNLHCRLAYNSASFALSALYSMAFLGGQSFHCGAGFFALLVAWLCCGLEEITRRRYVKPSDFARVMGIYYLLMIFDEMVSPASDYFMVLTAFYLIIRWMDLLEEEEESVFPYAMLCVLGVFLITVKLSAAFILLLVIKPAVMLLREKRGKETVFYLFLGVFAAAPFFIRNILLSGWLVYPFTGIDIIQADWKIPKGIAAYDAKEIQVWGRGYSDVMQYDMPVREWLPAWFRGLGMTDKMLVLAAFLSVGIFCIRLVWKLLHNRKIDAVETVFSGNVSSNGAVGQLLLEGVVAVCFLFWLLSSPLMRYGCVYVYLVSAVVWGDMLTEFFHGGAHGNRYGGMQEKRGRNYLEQAVIFVIGLFIAYKAVALGKELSAFYVDDYWVYQKDYENYDTERYEIDGYTFYVPVTGDQTGYEAFPSSPTKAQIRLRGDEIRDGFTYIE